MTDMSAFLTSAWKALCHAREFFTEILQAMAIHEQFGSSFRCHNGGFDPLEHHGFKGTVKAAAPFWRMWCNHRVGQIGNEG